jgi:hypothetical protein
MKTNRKLFSRLMLLACAISFAGVTNAATPEEITPKTAIKSIQSFVKNHKKKWKQATHQAARAFVTNTSIVKAGNESMKAFLKSWKEANPEQQTEFYEELLAMLDKEVKDGPVRDMLDEGKNLMWYAKYRRHLIAAVGVGGFLGGLGLGYYLGIRA